MSDYRTPCPPWCAAQNPEHTLHSREVEVNPEGHVVVVQRVELFCEPEVQIYMRANRSAMHLSIFQAANLSEVLAAVPGVPQWLVDGLRNAKSAVS